MDELNKNKLWVVSPQNEKKFCMKKIKIYSHSHKNNNCHDAKKKYLFII